MRRDLPPRHRGSHCNLHAPTAPLHNHPFPKGCPSPLLAVVCATAVIAPSQAAAPCGLLAGGRTCCRRAAGSRLRAGHWRSPFACTTLQPAPLRATRYGRLPPLGLAIARRAHSRRPCVLLPLWVAAPCGLGLAVAWPWVAGPTWGLAVLVAAKTQ
ncbi:hypothetical protein GW17_00036907 [Ensete ventricosum]|nr:hypothetical protein GW17_00036907 [Ensete ventricosum]